MSNSRPNGSTPPDSSGASSSEPPRKPCGSLDDQIRLAGDRHEAGFGASVSVRLRKRDQRRSAEQKGLEHALVHHCDAARLHALVVVEVVAHQLDAAARLQRRVEGHTQEVGEYRLVDTAAERLPVVGVALAVTLDAVAEDLVEEDAGARPKESPGLNRDRRSARFAARRAAPSSARVGDSSLHRQAVERAREVAGIKRESMPATAFVVAWMKCGCMSPVASGRLRC